MTESDDRQAVLARFVEQWCRSAQWHYAWQSWQSWQPPSTQRRDTAPGPDHTGAGRAGAAVGTVGATADEFIDRGRLGAAARRALELFPGPIGELISREIQAYLGFGFRFDRDGLIARLAERVLTTELPIRPGAAPIASSAAPGSDTE